MLTFRATRPRLLFLLCCVASAFAFSEPSELVHTQLAQTQLAPSQAPDQPPPNIVLILADDLGYCDTSLYDCTTIPTPAIASIAQQGVTFTDAYVTAATCSPSRAALLTGRYQQRFGFEFNTGSARVTNDQKRGLPKNLETVADHLRKAGYRTGLVGKWHQGNTDGYRPLDRGFDEFYGFLPGARSYFQDQPNGENAASRRVAPDDRRASPRPVGGRGPFNGLFRGRDPVTAEPDYLTDALAREASSFIDRHHQRPFFLYLAFSAPHTPIEATQEYVDRFPADLDPVTRTYRAMVSALDDGIGRVLRALDEHALAENTLVVFLSDNGCATYTLACSNDPLREGKLFLFEGGVRVPMALRYPSKIEGGATISAPVSSLDLFPTLLSAAGVTSDTESAPDLESDGVDLLPFLQAADGQRPHEHLYWRNGPNRAVRSQQWKLFWNDDHDWLFDLGKDLAEHKNLASQNPGLVRKLKQRHLQWQEALAEPAWPSRPGRSKKIDGVTVEVHV